MKFHLKQIQDSLLSSQLTEPQIISILELISKGFTSNRSDIKKYVNDEDFVSAYTYFYLPTNIPKLEFLLNELSEDLINKIQKSHIVDVGTGPGTFAFAFDEYFNGEVTVTGVDSSLFMLKQATKINENLYNNNSISFLSEVPSDFVNGTLFFGHSLNEMGEKRAIDLIEMHDPETIIFIEPGTKAVFNQMISIRNNLSHRGYDSHYPCQNAKMKCPVAEKSKKGIDDWCHQVIRTTHDPEVERLSQLIKLDRKVMPLIAHVYSKSQRQSKQKFRMIRFLRESKFSFDWEVCFEEDNSLVSKNVEVLKKSLSKKEIKELKSINVGHEYDFEIIKKLSDTHYRVKLISL